MEDSRIVALYWQRDPGAITQTQRKYGGYCYSIAMSILGVHEDAQECVNDTWQDAWNSIPPHKPSVLGTFLGKITRRISIDRWRRLHAQKRGGGEMTLALEELADCIPGGRTPEQELDNRHLGAVINDFVGSLPTAERRVFLRRYWYLEPVKTIARDMGFSESKVKSLLFRSRQKLRQILEMEGFA